MSTFWLTLAIINFFLCMGNFYYFFRQDGTGHNLAAAMLSFLATLLCIPLVYTV